MAADGSTSAAEAPTGAGASFEGTYRSAVGSLYIPDSKDWSSVKPAKEDGSKHVGEGALTLDIAADGAVSGAITSGPAAPAILEGRAEGDVLTGTVRREDVTDEGLTGTFHATRSGGELSGTMKLADANAGIVREAKVTAKARAAAAK